MRPIPEKILSPSLTLLFLLALALTGMQASGQIASPSQPRFVKAPAGGPQAFGNDVVYYIMVDRFYDGEPDNNVPLFAYPDDANLSKKQRSFNALNRAMLPMMYDPTRSCLGQYFGGDLEGVRQKLPYLAELGVTQLVLSPIMENANGFLRDASSKFLRRGPGHEPNAPYHEIVTAYHGYWTRDWWRLEEHFINSTDYPHDPFAVFRRLLNEAAELGIGIILDITLNHTSPIVNTFIDGGDLFADGQLLHHFDHDMLVRQSDDYFNRYFSIDFTNPSEYDLQHGTLDGGMPDLNQHEPEVERYLTEVALFWLQFNREDGAGISGFRLDAVKHVYPSFWRHLENQLVARKPDIILLGEFFEGGLLNPESIVFLEETRYITMYDFNLSIAAQRFFAGDHKWLGRAYVLRQLLLGEGERRSMMGRWWHRIMNPAGTLEVPDGLSRRISYETMTGWVAFLDNHDLPRVRTAYPDMTNAQYKSLLAFQFAIPRVPSLYYGDETALAAPADPRQVGLFGVGGDPFNRQMMIFPGDPGWDQAVFDYTRKLISFRKANPVLRYGNTRILFPEGASRHEDLFFIRFGQGESASQGRILFAYSADGLDARFTEQMLQADRAIDAVTGEVFQTQPNGEMRIALSAHRARVLILE